MNASFRTAFWAMCLGITVPMMLFIGVELFSGTDSGAKAQPPAGSGSLQAHWNDEEARKGGDRPGKGVAKIDPRLETDDDPRGTDEAGGAPASGNSSRSPGAAVVMEPPEDLELSPSFDRTGTNSGLPRFNSGRRPRALIQPEVVTSSRSTPTAHMEAQLDQILGYLDRLSQMGLAQKPATDPMQQATELLLRLQEARRIQELAAPAAAAVENIQSPSPTALPTPPPSDPATPQPAATTAPSESGKNEGAGATGNAPVTMAPRLESKVPGSPASARRSLAPPLPKLQTKIYHPRFVSAGTLRALATPLLTPGVGRISAPDATDSFEGEAGAGSWTSDAIVIRDNTTVLRKFDKLARDIDVPPSRVYLETTAITVRLPGGAPLGIDLSEYNASGQSFTIGRAQPVPGTETDAWIPSVAGAGLKSGLLRGDPGAFLGKLQTSTQVRGIAASQTTVSSGQPIDLRLGQGYSAPSERPQAAAPSSLLRIIPSLTRDGQVQLDVGPHPGATTETDGEITAGRGAVVSSQILLSPGETAVVAGYFTEQLVHRSYRNGRLGQWPVVGKLFREEAAVLERSETILLLTPRIMPGAPRTPELSQTSAPPTIQPISHRQPAARRPARRR
ncbi:MAG: hypothetical protein ACKV0T_31600 [Planctomycetales bacterium]